MSLLMKIVIACVLLASPAAMSSGMGSAGPSCHRAWSDFDVTGAKRDPYGVCFASPTDSDKSCFESARKIRDDKNVWIAIRREQMKLVLTQEVWYASRFKALSHGPLDHWEVLRSRWRRRLTDDQEVMVLDRDPKLGKDRCALSLVLGFDCGSSPAFDILGVHRARAWAAEESRSAGRKYPDGISYQLLSAILLLETLATNSKTAAAQKAANVETIDSVISFLPELAIDPYLRMRVKSVARRQGLISRILKIDFAAMDMQQRLDRIEETLENSPALTSRQISFIEEEFFKSNDLLLKILDAQLLGGRENANFVFDQDYLLYAFAKHERQRGNSKSAGLLQASICGNELVNKRSAQRLEIAKLGLATLGLVTGVGAMFDIGIVLSATFVATMSTSMIAVSAIDIYQAAATSNQERDLFALKAVPYSDWKAAQDKLTEAIPWAVVNVAATAPVFALAKIHSARRAAQIAGDFEKVRKLEAYQKATITIAMSMGVALTAVQLPEAYKNAKEFLDDAPSVSRSRPDTKSR